MWRSMKNCSSCGIKKRSDEFYSDKRTWDMLYSACKDCHNERNKRWQKSSENYKDYTKEKNKVKNTYANKKVYLSKPDEQEKQRARHALFVAVKKGDKTRLPCQRPGCQTLYTEAHHHLGYKKENWLDVLWLCIKHHAELHSDERKSKKLTLKV